MTIRIGTVEDISTIQDLNHSLFLSDKENDPELVTDWPYSPAGEAYFRSVLVGEESVCFIAEDQGVAIGYLAGTVRQKTYRTRRMSELENMYISLDHRSSGIGRLLMESFFVWSRKMKADSCIVDAYTPNVRAIEFYRKNGFGDYSTVLERVLEGNES